MSLTFEERRVEHKERARQQIAQIAAEGLMAQWEAVESAEIAEQQATDAKRAALKKYTEMLAAALGITVGLRVSVRQQWGYRRPIQYRTSVYEVVGWHLSGPTKLTLRGKSVLKSGGLGEVHEVPSGWEKVQS